MKRFFAILLLFIQFWGTSLAQQDDLNFINISSKNGLSSNSINAIIKDHYGYMWFATDDGLNRFDGVNFKVYRHNPADSSSIDWGSVNALLEDTRGNLWLAAGTSLAMYDREKDAFINYRFAENGVRSLCYDHKGNIWIASYSGLFVFDPVTKGTRRFIADGKPGSLNSSTVISVFEDSRRRIWVGTNDGLNLYEGGANFKCFSSDDKDPSSLPDKVIRAIVEDFNGNLWFGTKEGGICVLEPDGKNFRTYQHRPNDPSTLSSNRVFTMSLDNEGKLWVGTEDGLNIFDPQLRKAVRIGQDQRNRYSFTGKSVRSLFIDKDGICWIGTFRSGVNKYDKNLAFFNLRQGNSFDPRGLSSSTVTSFVEADNGDIYIGTDGGGLNLLRRASGLFDHPPFTGGKEPVGQTILSMEMAGDELWIGTYPDGVFVRNIKTGATRHYVKGEGAKYLSSNEIFCIKKDSRGNIWIGTNGNGLSVYDPVTSAFHRFDPRDIAGSRAEIPSNGFIRSIAEDRFGNIWIGSHGTGIAIFDPWRGTFRQLTTENSGLPHHYVINIFKAGDGTIWVGTAGYGLSRFDYASNRFTTYSESDGLANGFVHKILEDDAGKLWLSTNSGISSFDPSTKKFKNYSHHNGLQQSSFCGGSGLKTSKGELFFGGLDGFNFFNPRAFQSGRTVPSLVLTDLRVSNRSVVPGEKSPIDKHIAVATEIHLNYKQNFSIEYAALNFTAPQETRYSYRLEGFDKGWNDVGQAKSAVYTNLAPGKYLFRLRARSEDGSWSTPESTITIFVKPPLWRTGYAYALYVVVAVLILWIIRRQGIRRIKNKFALEQERLQFRQMLEQERREAERQHEFDEVKIKFLTNLSHEFRTPISLIASPAEQLLDEEEDENRREQLSLIKRNARRLLNLVNQLLDFRKLEESESTLVKTDGDFVPFVKEVADSFRDMSERKRIDFSFSSTVPHYFTSFDKDKMERILFNLLSNAFKFTREHGRISLKVERNEAAGLRVIVSDTGIGMDPETRQKVFERFFQGDSARAILNQGTGIGLSITREFVRMHGGTIDVESISGKGSSFILNLPLQPIEGSESLSSSPLEPVGETGGFAETESGANGKPVVLIVDDHHDFLSYLERNLKAQYKIVTASDGRQAWQKTLATHPQVIVSDINMPEMDGIALCRKIRSDKRTRHIPIILLTALTGDANQLTGLDTGANDYLTKPFNFDILHLRIRNLLKLNQELKNTYSQQLKVVSSGIEVESEDERFLRTVIAYIEKNLDSAELTVEELSKHTYMSRGTLYNRIVKLTGETPVEFIRSVKLDKAADLLENSDLKVSQVGYSVGFTSPNYFARAFKAKFNVSPSDYARQKRKAD